MPPNDVPDFTDVTQRPQKLVGTIPTGTPAGTSTFPIETGVHAIALAWTGNAPTQGQVPVVVNGHQSGLTYLSASVTQLTNPGYLVAPFLSALDSSVDVVYALMGNTAAPIDVVAIYDVAAVDVLASTGAQTLPVSLISSPYNDSNRIGAYPALSYEGGPSPALSTVTYNNNNARQTVNLPAFPNNRIAVVVATLAAGGGGGTNFIEFEVASGSPILSMVTNGGPFNIVVPMYGFAAASIAINPGGGVNSCICRFTALTF